MSARRDRWDVFCRVVDHFGDVGIAWRIARQIAADGTRAVRLFVDGIDVLATIEPRIDPRRSQTIDGVDIAPWPADDGASLAPAAVVVELLGCRLPARYLASMARRPVAPVWIDYEHLSAEAWVDGFHGLPSPHPTLPLVKHFFYPGFGPRTGGLPIEPHLLDAIGRDRFDGDAVWRDLGIAAPEHDGARPERRMSLFAYPSAPVDALAAALGADPAHRWTIVVPSGAPGPSAHGTRVVRIPFVDQPTYDRLLAACDVDFVRGEDSFVRAQVAGRPMVWQAYVQPDGAHLAKLSAFEARYAVGMAADAAAVQRALWDAWNRADDAAVSSAAPAWLAALPALAIAARRWQADLVRAVPLVERLATFVDDVRRRAPGATGTPSWP